MSSSESPFTHGDSPEANPNKDSSEANSHGDSPTPTETEEEKKARRSELLEPDNLQRLLADALTYKSPLKDLITITRCGGDVNAPVKRGLRPLHYAVHANYTEGIQFLLENGADVNAPDDIGYRPVHLCARKGLLEPLKVLMDHGAKFDFFCDATDGETAEDGRARNIGFLTIEPLNMALENGHAETARLLLSRGARPDHRYFMGHEINLVPLENIECLKVLLEFGADPNVFSRCGLTPLMKACKQHSIRACRILVESGADKELQPPDQFEQKTALHFAIESGSSGICSLLLRNGASTLKPPNYKYSALHTAVTRDQPSTCEMLLRWEARVDERTDEASTPLQLACATPGLEHREDMIRTLLSHGADINVHSPFVSYSSPYLSPLTEYLRCVTHTINLEIVRMLLLYGSKVHFKSASTSGRNRDPHGILHCVQYMKRNPEVFNLLLSAADGFELDSISAYTSLSTPQREALMSVCTSPRDLRTLSHLCLRDHMTGSLISGVPRLPVPNMVKEYLLFNNPPSFLTKHA